MVRLLSFCKQKGFLSLSKRNWDSGTVFNPYLLTNPIALRRSKGDPQKYDTQNNVDLIWQSFANLTQFGAVPVPLILFQLSLWQFPFLFPCRFQDNACLAIQSWGFLSLCPINLQKKNPCKLTKVLWDQYFFKDHHPKFFCYPKRCQSL